MVPRLELSISGGELGLFVPPPSGFSNFSASFSELLTSWASGRVLSSTPPPPPSLPSGVYTSSIISEPGVCKSVNAECVCVCVRAREALGC